MMMTRQIFDDALNRYGGDLSRWPEALRNDAQALVASEPGFAAELEALSRLETDIATAIRPRAVDSALVGRIISGTQGEIHTGDELHPTGRLAAWAGGATVALFAIGFAFGFTAEQDIGEDSIASLMFGDTFIEENGELTESIL